MRTSISFAYLVGVGVAVTVAACGGAPAAPQAPASSAAPIATVAAPPPPDVSPVAAPAGLVLTGTVPKLGTSLGTVKSWLPIPMPQSEQVTEAMTGVPMGALVDLDQPIHFAVSISGSGMSISPLIAVSAGIRDLEAAKSALAARFKLVPWENGGLLIQSLGHAGGDTNDDSSDDDARPCAIEPSFGAPAMRLVCGVTNKSLSVLGPWLTRGATRAPLPTADLHADFKMEALKPTVQAARKLLPLLLGSFLDGAYSSGGGKKLLGAVVGDLADFAGDLDGATLDVQLGDPGASLNLALQMSGAKAVVTRLLTANSDRNAPPPAAFWQMPGDADFAVFGRGMDPNVAASVRDLVLQAMGDRFAEDGVKDGDRHAITDALGKVFWPAAGVFASGVDADAARKALAALKALPDAADRTQAADAQRAASEALIGWRVVELDEPAAARIDAMKALVKAWSAPGVATAYAKAPHGMVHLRTAPMPMFKGITVPKDAQHFVVEVPLVESAARPAPPKKSAPSKPVTIDVVMVPDSARTWVGFGGDLATVLSKLTSAMSGSGDGLRTRPELAAFKDQTLGSAGFVTGRGVAAVDDAMKAILGGDPGGFPNTANVFEMAAQAPHQGTTPILFSLTAPPPSGTQTTAQLNVQLPRATLDDLLVVALKHGF
jgi:hypothetical protein